MQVNKWLFSDTVYFLAVYECSMGNRYNLPPFADFSHLFSIQQVSSTVPFLAKERALAGLESFNQNKGDGTCFCLCIMPYVSASMPPCVSLLTGGVDACLRQNVRLFNSHPLNYMPTVTIFLFGFNQKTLQCNWNL